MGRFKRSKSKPRNRGKRVVININDIPYYFDKEEWLKYMKFKVVGVDANSELIGTRVDIIN